MKLTWRNCWVRCQVPVLSMVLGGVATVLAITLVHLIRLITNVAYFGRFSFEECVPGNEHWGWGAIFVPMVGGLLVGVLARYGSSAIRGHGIPEAMQAVETADSRIPGRVAILKPLSAAIAVGTGGPFGAEGPIIATGGALGSLFGQWIPCNSQQRKVLLVAGAAAGMAAIFGTPFTAVLLAMELLLFEYRARSILPVTLAAGTAMAFRSYTSEALPMFPLHMNQVPDLVMSIGALVVGLCCGVLSVGITKSVHWVEEQFEKLPIHWMWWPMIGGLAAGLIGWVDPRTLGAGYFNFDVMLAGKMSVVGLLSLGFLKFWSWNLAMGSGTSGGSLAPLMMIGGALGGVVCLGIQLFPGCENFPMMLAVLVGMTATFAGASRAFLASVAFAFEATHAENAFGPLLLGCGAAVLISRVMMRETLMTEKLARRGVKMPRDFEGDFFRETRVREVMESEPLTALESDTVASLLEKLNQCGTRWYDVRLVPIVDGLGRLKGVISRSDLLLAAEGSLEVTVLDAGVMRPIFVTPEDDLAEVSELMLRHSIGRLPVVDVEGCLVGLVTRRTLLEARRRLMN